MAYAASTRAKSILSGIILGMALEGLLWPTPTSADTVGIPLTGGTLTLGLSDSFLNATGPAFSINAASGPLGLVLPGCPGSTCSPGSFFSTSTSIFGATAGNVSYAGVSESITDALVPGAAFASWSAGAGSILIPPIGDSFTVTEPFLIALQVRFANCATCFPSNNGTLINATGEGVATFSFAPMAFGPPAWGLTSGVYRIATPEPATWLLVVTGVAGLAWWRKRGRG
jgi:PEP-CTERM motif